MSAGVAGLLLIPLAKLSSSESTQVAWLPKPGLSNVGQFFVTQ